MNKQALCIPRAALPLEYQYTYNDSFRALLPFKEVLNDWTILSMQDRSTCETDPYFLQIIPYIVVWSGPNILCYSRGKAGDEDRLHAKLSIGFGGHIDSMIPLGQTTKGHILAEAVRELKEELGIDISPSQIKFEGYLMEGETEVGQVHLGVYCSCRLPDDQTVVGEQGTINSLEISTLTYLLHKYNQLEIWSQLIVEHLTSSQKGTVLPHENPD